jgi:hypothetical protein
MSPFDTDAPGPQPGIFLCSIVLKDYFFTGQIRAPDLCGLRFSFQSKYPPDLRG